MHVVGHGERQQEAALVEAIAERFAVDAGVFNADEQVVGRRVLDFEPAFEGCEARLGVVEFFDGSHVLVERGHHCCDEGLRGRVDADGKCALRECSRLSHE